ncbi:MAG: transcription antitermination factor NusB [Bacteroidia bacterium]|nr:MAG: transcription antitermination factor NusB [Bacteroidia bacterium]
MLNRRHLRVKVLQSLYAFMQSNNEDLSSGEKELLYSIDKIYELYLFQLMLLAELVYQEDQLMGENMSKYLPTDEERDPNRRMVENKTLRLIADDPILQKKARNKGVNWQGERELVRKLIQQIKKQAYYKAYMSEETVDEEADLRFVLKMINKDILPGDALYSFYEEKSIYWLDDWELVNKMIIKTLKNIREADGKLVLMDLYKDPADKKFAVELFRKCILNHREFHTIISAKTKNWDVERIALMDMIIMEMALTEILKFPEIPVKVSLNEYIELSKIYSTPKSKIFVNGVLDKLVEEFIRDKLISPAVSGLDDKSLQ